MLLAEIFRDCEFSQKMIPSINTKKQEKIKSIKMRRFLAKKNNPGASETPQQIAYVKYGSTASF